MRLILGCCLEIMAGMDPDSVDAIVTDPPYGLKFMGKEWDRGIPGVPFWRAALNPLKPGGYATIFGGTRTYHRLACVVEDAGFEIRDCMMWLYAGNCMPKSRACLKPAYEPILLCRKPGKGVMPLGIDECRISIDAGDLSEMTGRSGKSTTNNVYSPGMGNPAGWEPNPSGRWPANIAHDGEPDTLDLIGNAARFFYCAKASKTERGEANNHPTVKPLALLRWLVKLICPVGGTVLDPFAGSGTTLLAAKAENREAVGIEINPDYYQIAQTRLEHN